MSVLSRRSLLTGAVAAGAVLAGARVLDPKPGIAARVNGVRLTREEHRVVVIGSGFGGGVTALRLAEAGVPVLLLERGKWKLLCRSGSPHSPSAETSASASSG